MKIKYKKILILTARVLLTVFCIIYLVHFTYHLIARKKLNDKLEKLKASSNKVFIVFNGTSRFAEQDIKLPPSSNQIILFHTCDVKSFHEHDYKDPFYEVLTHCECDGKAYEITGNAIKEFLSALEFDKDAGSTCMCSGKPKFLFLSKDNKLLECLHLKHGKRISSNTFSRGDLILTKSSQKKLKVFLTKHKFPVFD
jgi:hypothetical protein